ADPAAVLPGRRLSAGDGSGTAGGITPTCRRRTADERRASNLRAPAPQALAPGRHARRLALRPGPARVAVAATPPGCPAPVLRAVPHSPGRHGRRGPGNGAGPPLARLPRAEARHRPGVSADGAARLRPGGAARPLRPAAMALA